MQDDNNEMQSLYQYPATCTKFDKEGNITSSRIVTHSARGTKELHSLYPELNKVIKRLGDKEGKPRRESTNVSKLFPDQKTWRMMFQLGKY